MSCGLAGTVQLSSFVNLRKLDLWRRCSESEDIGHATAEWVWETSTVVSDSTNGLKLDGGFVSISSHTARQLSALVNLEEIVSTLSTIFCLPSHMLQGVYSIASARGQALG